MLQRLEEIGKQRAQDKPSLLDAYLTAIKPDDLATIIYTSGTTANLRA